MENLFSPPADALASAGFLFCQIAVKNHIVGNDFLHF